MSARSSARISVLMMLAVAVGEVPPDAAAQPNSGQRRSSVPQRGGAGRSATDASKNARGAPQRGIDGRAEAHARADDRYTALPMVTQPRHTTFKPLDPADTRTAIFELAELASFEVYRDGDASSTTNGLGRGAQMLPIDPVEQLDRTVRFDRLMTFSDRNFTELVGKVRGITEDVTRLNRANHDFGIVAGLEESLAFQSLALNAMAAISRWHDLEVAGAQATTTERLPGGRTIERFDQARYNELAGKDSLVTGILGSGADRNRASTAEKLERRKLLARRTDAIRGLLQERMTAVWDKELMPRLEQHAGPPAEKLPLEIGPASAPRDPQVPPPRYGEVEFRNRAGKLLEHVTLAVRLRDNFANETLWYLHLPRLETKPAYHLVAPNWARRVYPGGADKIEGTYTFYSETARAVDRPLDLERAAPRSPRTQERRDKALQDFETLVKEEATRRAEERDVLAFARTTYPAARNPETTRARLIAALQKGLKYRARFTRGNQSTDVALELQPFAADAAEVLASLTVTAGGETEKLSLMGRIADEADRGCVVGFVPVEGEPHELKLAREVAERMAAVQAKMGTKSPPSPLTAVEARSKLRLARWKKGGLPLFTSPTEFLSDWQPEQLRFSGQHAAEVRAAIDKYTEQRRQWEFACDVIYIDEAGRLWLQHMPAAGLRTELDYALLQPE